MQVLKEKLLIHQQVDNWRKDGNRIAFVPTMGNLHEGHFSLVREAKRHAEKVVVSIFVNPMQFNNPQDLLLYPRTMDQDCSQLQNLGVDLVYAPTVEELYPEGSQDITFVDVPKLSTMLEGASRPGHFRGVTTVVSKLFHIVNPDVACFGEKDFQQVAIIKKMVRDLNFFIEIIQVPIVRADDGLALSSRNGYLTSEERKIAPNLYKILKKLAQELSNGNGDLEKLIAETNTELSRCRFIPDQLEICDSTTLEPFTAGTKNVVILAAAWLGKARLIDNIQTTIN
ncbi:pantoate-beta-alanine ligase [Schizosaccharomyces pombe]|uniref:Pantoate--beta-alanine ligase n=1 Tax=Schizosaccharomyces pombe (strain 972 / ATCC 24843) TaxID=284812 RepID=PANC_SCHPO|nr:pantoate-beta-alanine ligase [Schizosaccharomyces pombe]Q09673.1 RecName: Full=Pantoate--beta-alanine ligase; AltName: Full=Pantoate-activating enzyme; AltName: Full=Pantothenate synthetase [Schizosaccharomyces pombe 972h-]CAA89958.1 pantoate-beta-alanine ligase [Schizosaccharomyces pombe]|eukprot:NP_592821.1 pantoate-beta-alanine ligase [Schizosaccharomyces pombe]